MLPSTKKLMELRGWDSLDLTHPARELSKKEAQVERMNAARLVSETFATDSGKRLLEQLVQAKIMRPAPRGLPEYERGLFDGEGNLVRYLLSAIDYAQTGGET